MLSMREGKSQSEPAESAVAAATVCPNFLAKRTLRACSRSFGQARLCLLVWSFDLYMLHAFASCGMLQCRVVVRRDDLSPHTRRAAAPPARRVRSSGGAPRGPGRYLEMLRQRSSPCSFPVEWHAGVTLTRALFKNRSTRVRVTSYLGLAFSGLALPFFLGKI